jgi:hypothetical protein
VGGEDWRSGTHQRRRSSDPHPPGADRAVGRRMRCGAAVRCCGPAAGRCGRCVLHCTVSLRLLCKRWILLGKHLRQLHSRV